MRFLNFSPVTAEESRTLEGTGFTRIPTACRLLAPPRRDWRRRNRRNTRRVETVGISASAGAAARAARMNTGEGPEESKVLGTMLPLIRVPGSGAGRWKGGRWPDWWRDGAGDRARATCCHWSAKYTQNVPWITAGLRVRPGVRWSSSAARRAPVGDVHLAALEGGQPRGLVGDRGRPVALDGGRLPPV